MTGMTGWRKASASGNNGCVEVSPGIMRSGERCVMMRDSKNQGGPVLVFTLHEWECFADGVSKGEFADLGGDGSSGGKTNACLD